MNKALIFILLLLSPLWGRSFHTDSLKTSYNEAPNDSLKARICLELGDYYEDHSIDDAIKWGNRAIYHARKFDNREFLMKVLNYGSTYYHKKGDYRQQANLCLEAMRIAEREHFDEQQGGIAGNLGAAYIGLEDKEEAIKWLMKSIQIKEKYSSPEKQVISISNLGGYYVQLEDYEKAAKYHLKALELKREFSPSDIDLELCNLATSYMMLDRFDEAQALYREAYAIRTANDDQYGLCRLMLEHSWLFERKKELSTAILYADSAYNAAIELEYPELEHDAAIQLGTVYKAMGNASKGYEYLLIAYNLWKEMHQQQAAENLNELRTKYETDKVESENLLLKKNSEIKDLRLDRNDAQISNQRVIIASAIGGLSVLVIIIYFLNKWNREKREKNHLLQEQKKLVETKNDEIFASINYAKRIQSAILPQAAKLQTALPNSFVYYQPKDVVAGDFYWLEELEGKTLFAVADCTGHGVPGAMVSVVCNNGLNRSVREYGSSIPGEILDKTREIVVAEFEKSEDEVKDGMDIALCSLKGNTLEYAGAHNALWLIRNGEVIEYKANKQPIGKFENPMPYTTHTIALQPGDTFYLFSDGFADQFGGPENKKYKSLRFKNFLLSIQGVPMDQQRERIAAEFENWKGKEEQIDDVCVFGMRFDG